MRKATLMHWHKGSGLFLLAWHRGELGGGVGLRMLEAKVIEMKRLFVRDHFKSKG
jgi:hypothetical protein